MQGQLDTALSERGRWQAARAAEALAGEGIEAIVSSDLARAYDTAAAIAARRRPADRDRPRPARAQLRHLPGLHLRRDRRALAGRRGALAPPRPGVRARGRRDAWSSSTRAPSPPSRAIAAARARPHDPRRHATAACSTACTAPPSRPRPRRAALVGARQRRDQPPALHRRALHPGRLERHRAPRRRPARRRQRRRLPDRAAGGAMSDDGRAPARGRGDAVDAIDTPALVIDLDAMERNLAAMAAFAREPRRSPAPAREDAQERDDRAAADRRRRGRRLRPEDERGRGARGGGDRRHLHLERGDRSRPSSRASPRSRGASGSRSRSTRSPASSGSRRRRARPARRSTSSSRSTSATAAAARRRRPPASSRSASSPTRRRKAACASPACRRTTARRSTCAASPSARRRRTTLPRSRAPRRRPSARSASSARWSPAPAPEPSRSTRERRLGRAAGGQLSVHGPRLRRQRRRARCAALRARALRQEPGHEPRRGARGDRRRPQVARDRFRTAAPLAARGRLRQRRRRARHRAARAGRQRRACRRSARRSGSFPATATRRSTCTTATSPCAAASPAASSRRCGRSRRAAASADQIAPTKTKANSAALQAQKAMLATPVTTSSNERILARRWRSRRRGYSRRSPCGCARPIRDGTQAVSAAGSASECGSRFAPVTNATRSAVPATAAPIIRHGFPPRAYLERSP